MKKLIALLLFAAMLLACAVGCAKPEPEIIIDYTNHAADNTEQEKEPTPVDSLYFLPQDFALGFGELMIEFTVEKDGSFSGTFRDPRPNETGKDYPNGVMHLADFEGRFTDFKQINYYTYSMTLAELTLEREVGEEWIEGGVKYYANDAFGLAGGTEFFLYTEDALREKLPEPFLGWAPADYVTEPDTLTYYGIYNPDNQMGFFTYDF